MSKIESKPDNQPAEVTQLPEDTPYETESAFKPLIWLLVPFILLMLYAGLA